MGNTIRLSENRAYLNRDGYKIIGEIDISRNDARNILENTSNYTVILGRSTSIDRLLLDTILNKHKILYEYNCTQKCIIFNANRAGIINDTHYTNKDEIKILHNIRKEDSNLINKLIKYLHVGVLQLVLDEYEVKEIYLANRNNNREYKYEYIDIKIHSQRQLISLCEYYTAIGYSIKGIAYNVLKVYKE